VQSWSVASLVLLLSACRDDTPTVQPATLDLATGQPPRVITQTVPMLGPLPAPPKGTGNGYRSDFVRVFTDGLKIDRPDEQITVSVRGVGAVVVAENGPLVADDPLGPDTPLKLPIKLVPEHYPVQVSRALIQPTDGSQGETLVAAARLLVGDGTPVLWHWIGQYTLHSGLGAFMSGSAANALVTRRDALVKAIVTAVQADPNIATSIPTRPAAPADLAFFPAGTGQGSVELYVGVDGSGLPVEVVADFLVLVEPEELVTRVEDPDDLAPGNLHLSGLNTLGIDLRKARPDEVVPLTGAPCWFFLDAQAIARDPRIGFPRIRCVDDQGRPVALLPTTEGYRLWLARPPDGVVVKALSVVIQLGVRSL